MGQSRLGSFIEANTSTWIGLISSWLLQQFYVSPFITHTSVSQNVYITFLFTILSLVRGYLVRRYYNWRLHRHEHH